MKPYDKLKFQRAMQERIFYLWLLIPCIVIAFIPCWVIPGYWITIFVWPYSLVPMLQVCFFILGMMCLLKACKHV